MVPRRGEQHLDSNHATDAENASLYSGELRPLNKPSLAHEFCKPDQPCFVSPKPIVPPIVRPPIPEDCVAPLIITQPVANEEVLPGVEVTFSVGVDPESTGPLQYQWYKAGAPVAGATGPTLTFIADASDNGLYLTVLVLGPCGEELSQAALITVDTTGVIPPACVPYSCSAYEDSLAAQGVSYIPIWAPSAAEMEWPFTNYADENWVDTVTYDVWSWYVSAPARNYGFGGTVELYNCSGIAGSETSPTMCDGDINRCIYIEADSSQTALTPTRGDGTIGIWGQHHISQVFAYHNGQFASGTGVPYWLRWVGSTGYGETSIFLAAMVGYITHDSVTSETTIHLHAGQHDGSTAVVTKNVGVIDGKWNHATFTAGSSYPSITADPDHEGHVMATTESWAEMTVNGQRISITGGRTRNHLRDAEVMGRKENRLLYEGAIYYRQAYAVVASISGMTFTDSPPDTQLEYLAFLQNYENYVPPAWCPIT